jgi:hypothetical protein
MTKSMILSHITALENALAGLIQLESVAECYNLEDILDEYHLYLIVHEENHSPWVLREYLTEYLTKHWQAIQDSEFMVWREQ